MQYNESMINTVETNGTFLISIVGRFSLDESTEWKNVVAAVAASSASVIEVNFCDCVYVDSIGIGLLLIMRHQLSSLNKSLKITGLTHGTQVATAIKVAGIHKIFNIDYKVNI